MSAGAERARCWDAIEAPRGEGPSAYLLLDRRAHGTPTPLLEQVADRLGEWGIELRMGVVEEMAVRPDELRPAFSAYLLKSYSDLALGLAAALDGRGARILNPYLSCALLRDKVATAAALRDAGVPAPRTWATADPLTLAPLLAETPLIIKPARGVHGVGVRVVREATELRRLREELAPDGAARRPLVAQELVPGPGSDLKLYVAGDRTFAVRKPFSAASHVEDGEQCSVPDRARKIALRTGRALGLRIYGLDLIEGPSGPVVVDVNYFPGFRGVPDAAEAVAAEVDSFVRDGALRAA